RARGRGLRSHGASASLSTLAGVPPPPAAGPLVVRPWRRDLAPAARPSLRRPRDQLEPRGLSPAIGPGPLHRTGRGHGAVLAAPSRGGAPPPARGGPRLPAQAARSPRVDDGAPARR